MTAAPAPVDVRVDHLFRHEAGRLVSTLARVLGLEHLELVEDAVQDAFLAALRTWPFQGVPDDTRAWIGRVARNAAIDRLRRGGLRRDREDAVRHALYERGSPGAAAAFDGELGDDTLVMIFTCCHPALGRDEQVALTLKTVGGFSVDELARAFLTSRATLAQRLVRAKRRLRDAGTRVEIPPPQALPGRRETVLEVLSVMFSEGHAATSGPALIRRDLCDEALRLAETLAAHPVAGSPDAEALAALLCFQAARLSAREDPQGEVLLLAEQDRSLWDASLVRRGLTHLGRSARGDVLSAYHLQAEIASCHAVAPCWSETDWARILHLYDRLLALQPSPVVALNRAAVVAEVEGPGPALEAIATAPQGAALERYLPAWVTRSDLLQRLGRSAEARAACQRALELGPSEPVRRLLERRVRVTTSAAPSPT